VFPPVVALNDDRRMARRSKVPPTHKRSYRVTNWPSYDRALIERGSLTVWFSPEVVKAWNAERTGQRGGQPRYSDLAVQTALHLRLLLRLPWRQTEGLLRSLIDLMDVRLGVPDHTTLSRRSRSRCRASSPSTFRADPSHRRCFRAQGVRPG